MRTPENLVRHELIGLKVRIAESPNKLNAGLEGKVIDETRNTLVMERTNGKEIRIQKERNVFSFELNSGRVRIEGRLLMGRPEDRIKKKFKKW